MREATNLESKGKMETQKQATNKKETKVLVIFFNVVFSLE
jgi:hypothetical protein